MALFEHLSDAWGWVYFRTTGILHRTQTSMLATRVMKRNNQSAGPDRAKVLIAGVKQSASAVRHDPEPFQAELREAKARFASALCLCQDGPLQMVIRERSAKLWLACWPDQAHAHAMDCPFYGAPNEGGSHQYTEGAITEDGPKTNILLHHPLLQETPKSRGPNKAPAVRASGLSKLHLWGLLHHLWESGGLNRWHPGWKRDWGMVRYMVRRAAQSTSVDGQPLLTNLYVPPIWTKERKGEIRAHWDEFTAPLFRQHRSTAQVASGIVIGLVRALEVTEGGFSVRLRNHSEVFYIDKHVADRLASYSRKGWSLLRSQFNDGPGAKPPMVVAALRVQAKPSESFVVVEGVLMRLSPSYIPVSSSFEERVAERLVAEDRRFVRPLHYDMQGLDLAHFVLTDCTVQDSPDTGPKRVALYVYGAAIATTYQRTLEAKDRKEAQRMGYGFWKWNVNESDKVPMLPQVFTSPNHQLTTNPTFIGENRESTTP